MRVSMWVCLVLVLLTGSAHAATLTFQGFESDAGDTWSYTSVNAFGQSLATYTADQPGFGAVWGPAASVANGGISPFSGGGFWGMRGTELGPAVSRDKLHVLRFDAVDLDGFTDVVLRFRIHSDGIDPESSASNVADIWRYQITLDGTPSPAVPLPLNSGAWVEIAVPIDDSVSTAAVQLEARTTSVGDNAGIDNVQLTGSVVVPEPAVLTLGLTGLLGLLLARVRADAPTV